VSTATNTLTSAFTSSTSPNGTEKSFDHVHSALSWEPVDNPSVTPMLPANGPILKALRMPRLMAITQAAEIGVERQLDSSTPRLRRLAAGPDSGAVDG